MFEHITRTFVLAALSFVLAIPAGAVAPKVDFNGDGRADVFLQNVFTGEVSAWLIGSSSVIQNPSYGTVAPSLGWTPIGLNDFNGDRRTDILWRNGVDGTIGIWLINGANILGMASIGTVDPNSGWALIDSKDFNGDGRADLLWRNTFSGEVLVWLLNGTRILQVASLGSVDPNSGWSPIDSKDFNGDGRADLLWRNAFDGTVAIWLVNGGVVLNMAALGTVNPNSGWVPINTEDYNGDGRADMLWRNTFTGDIQVWLINGVQLLQWASLGSVNPNSGWVLINSADFNGDGRADLLWRNAFNGTFAVWLINGVNVLDGASVGTVDPNSGWIPIGADDYNGDGRADVFWRQAFSNQTVAWIMNGDSILRQQPYNNVQPSSVWQIQIPN